MRKAILLGWLASTALYGQNILLRVRFAQIDATAEAILAPNLTATASNEIRTLRPGLDLVTFLEDLRARGGGVRILAEPTVLTSDAKPATVRAGDREFGINLTMQPALHNNGSVLLSVKPSVTTLNAVDLVTKKTFTTPSFGTRSLEANTELASGQSIWIEGLLDSATERLLRSIPGLTDRSAILAAIFRNGTQANTKLVVIVTPEVL